METEALRRQLSEEIASQFDAKLREAKRQKSLIEEEFELSSEKWRTERRRLNAEIDRLEAELSDSRQSGRDSSEAGSDSALDSQEIIRLQAAAEEKLKDATRAWETERAKLQAEVSRLQESIAAQIERSNNPLRSNPNDRGRLEAKCEEAVRGKRQAEEALLAAKTQWEAEKLTLVNDVTKLRASPAQAFAARRLDQQADKRLEETTRLHDGLAADLEKARQELAKLKEAHAAELQKLTARLQAAKTEWEAEKLNLVNLRDGLASDLEKARQEPAKLKEAHAAELQKLTARLQSPKTEWEAEKLNLVNLRDGLAADLEKARQEPAKLKEAHAAELQKLTARLQTAKTEWEAEKLNLVNETTKLRQTTAQAAQPAQAAQTNTPRKVDEQTDKRLQETLRLRDALTGDLEKARHEILKLKETHSAELQDFTSRYIKTRSDLEKQLRESEEARTRLERELEAARKASPPQDGVPSEEIARLQKELDDTREEKKRLVIRLAESGTTNSDAAVQDLRRQYETRMQEVMLENSQLSEKVKTATAQLDSAERHASPDDSGNNGNGVSTLDSASIDAEVLRVEALTAEIDKLIDDPETELAMVIRKNVERAALESYLKGILFSLGRGKGL